MKKTAVLYIMIGIITLLFIINAINYPVSLDIEADEVSTARIIYYGDGVEEEVSERKNINKLVLALNKLRFKKNRDMSHIFPRSGVIIIDLYDDTGKCIDSVQFYDWVYRGGEHKGEERENGEYMIARKGVELYDFYALCNDLCGNPFGI